MQELAFLTSPFDLAKESMEVTTEQKRQALPSKSLML
jgi:hypothetical protein